MKERNEGKPPHPTKFLRQRKFLLVLPVLVLPFLLLLAWTLGIVGEAKASKQTEAGLQGLNLSLPVAAPAKDSNWTKLQYYVQADKDSAKLRSLLKNDPYRKGELETGEEGRRLNEEPYKEYEPSLVSRSDRPGRPEEAEERVYQKLAELDKQLKTGERPPVKRDVYRSDTIPAVSTKEIDRLEQLMHTLHQGKETGEDPEMAQLNEMLNTILDIQHPERIQDKIKQQSELHKRQVFPVEKPDAGIISVLEAKKDFSELLHPYESDSMPEVFRAYLESNRFYGLEESTMAQEGQHAIPAVVPEDQTLVSGATVKFRLQEDVFIAGIHIPKDLLVYGLATLNGERLLVSVTAITYRNHILPVSLSVYDRDGIAGINIPGAMTRDVAKRSAAQSAQGLGAINTLDPSIGAQAVSAGLTMAQNLVGKSAKLVRVSVKAGYQVLLKDDNDKGK